jgi:hypothetical protein
MSTAWVSAARRRAASPRVSECPTKQVFSRRAVARSTLCGVLRAIRGQRPKLQSARRPSCLAGPRCDRRLRHRNRKRSIRFPSTAATLSLSCRHVCDGDARRGGRDAVNAADRLPLQMFRVWQVWARVPVRTWELRSQLARPLSERRGAFLSGLAAALSLRSTHSRSCLRLRVAACVVDCDRGVLRFCRVALLPCSAFDRHDHRDRDCRTPNDCPTLCRAALARNDVRGLRCRHVEPMWRATASVFRRRAQVALRTGS